MITQDCPPSMRTLSSTDLNFGSGESTAVISNAQKFIIPVPQWDDQGERLVYPQGSPEAGQPIVDYKGRPIGERGIIFFNAKDQAWQAVAGDGEGVVIINEVTQAQAQQLYQKIQSLQPNPNQLALTELKQVLTYAQEQLNLEDMYNSTRSYVNTKMTPVSTGDMPSWEGKEIEAYGFKKRDDRDVYQAIYVPGTFVFQGPAATAQFFEQGGVIIEQQGSMRGIQPDIFIRTYQRVDGLPITSINDISVQTMKNESNPNS